MGRWRVFAGFMAALVYLIFARVASPERIVVGLAVSLIGLACRAWAAGYLDKGRTLASDGPYAWIRHPLYAGSFLIAFGFGIAGTGSPYVFRDAAVWISFAVLFFVVYPTRIREEEATLERRFGDAWRAFTAERRRFWPRSSPVRRESPEHFLWSRYLRNKEYNAAIGWLTGALVVAAKAALQL